ncbi:MAG TPA: hypothetical protein VFL55_05175 [Acetobacteraceae bacterium]|nr:hypothetical protein [Acetobacteraceae bacterium]
MTVCWFAQFRRATVDMTWLAEVLAATPALEQGIVYTPAHTHDPYLNDGPPPALVLQLYFADIADLEAALAVGGHLQRLNALQCEGATQQAMVVRRYPVPDATSHTPPGEQPCTYLVAYEGKAEDLPAWLAHYIADHPPIMARFPGVRQIEIYTCMDWCGGLPWPRVAHMQRNKVVFDSPAALTEALNSPVRHEMRAAFHRFPPFTGPVTHFPMATNVVTLHAS